MAYGEQVAVAVAALCFRRLRTFLSKAVGIAIVVVVVEVILLEVHRFHVSRLTSTVLTAQRRHRHLRVNWSASVRRF